MIVKNMLNGFSMTWAGEQFSPCLLVNVEKFLTGWRALAEEKMDC